MENYAVVPTMIYICKELKLNTYLQSFPLYYGWESLRERSAKRYGLYIPLSSTSSYMPTGPSSRFFRDFPPVSLMLCFRRSIEVFPYLCYHSLFLDKSFLLFLHHPSILHRSHVLQHSHREKND